MTQPTPQDGAAPAPTPENWQAFFKAASALSGDYGNLINTPIGHPALSSESLLERIGEFVGAHTQVAEYLEEYIEKAPQESPRPTTGAAADVQGMILEILHSWPKATEIYFSPLQGGRGIEAFQAELMLNGGQTKSFQAETLELALIEAYTWLFEKPPAPRGEPTTEAEVLAVTGDTSDGFHTFNELYEHRHALFAVACNFLGGWKSKLHNDGTTFKDWFIAGLTTVEGPATYHLPMRLWDRFPGKELAKAPAWDGHAASDVISRLWAHVANFAVPRGEQTKTGPAAESWTAGMFTPAAAFVNMLRLWTFDQCKEFYAMLSRRPDFNPEAPEEAPSPAPLLVNLRAKINLDDDGEPWEVVIEDEDGRPPIIIQTDYSDRAEGIARLINAGKGEAPVDLDLVGSIAERIHYYLPQKDNEGWGDADHVYREKCRWAATEIIQRLRLRAAPQSKPMEPAPLECWVRFNENGSIDAAKSPYWITGPKAKHMREIKPMEAQAPAPTPWINTSERLPEPGKYVLTRHNRGTWLDSSDQENVNYVVVKLVLGISAAQRIQMERGEIPAPETSNGKRHLIYRGEDEWGNNQVAYKWEQFGPDSFFGQTITHWMPIPLPVPPDNSQKGKPEHE